MSLPILSALNTLTSKRILNEKNIYITAGWNLFFRELASTFECYMTQYNLLA